MPAKVEIVGFFFSVEPDVLEQHDVARAERAHRVFGLGSDAIRGKADRRAEQLTKSAPATGCSEYFSERVCHRVARDATGGRLCAPWSRRYCQRGQRGADARVVGDVACLHRHVEVDADYRGLAAPVHVTNGAEASHLAASRARQPSAAFRCPTSTGWPTISLRIGAVGRGRLAAQMAGDERGDV